MHASSQPGLGGSPVPQPEVYSQAAASPSEGAEQERSEPLGDSTGLAPSSQAGSLPSVHPREPSRRRSAALPFSQLDADGAA
jgi:hypothetical protein